jgi:prepilin-type N-terminal cleavage/methylation domain-containing protein
MNSRQLQSGLTPTLKLPVSLLWKGLTTPYWVLRGKFLFADNTIAVTQRRKNWCGGFTLVEMIVSLAIFSVVVTVSVGALLVLVGTNQRLQGEQEVMTNLSFALDSMTREIRTGSSYYCFSSLVSNELTGTGDLDSELDPGDVRNCTTGHGNNQNNWQYHGLAFIEGGDSVASGTGQDRILYYFDASSDLEQRGLYRRVGSGARQKIISPDIYIIDFDFFVSGTEDLNTVPSGDTNAEVRQPTVTIYIKAAENPDGSGQQFEVQTTVTQRTLDV